MINEYVLNFTKIREISYLPPVIRKSEQPHVLTLLVVRRKPSDSSDINSFIINGSKLGILYSGTPA